MHPSRTPVRTFGSTCVVNCGLAIFRKVNVMRLCTGCGSKMPEEQRGKCDECSGAKQHTVDTGIREHTSSKYTPEIDKLKTGPRWQRVRKQVIQRDPLCKTGCGALSEIVDHIVPAEIAIQQARDSGKCPYDQYAGFYLLTNLQGLCRSCHGKKTVKDKAHQGEWPNVIETELAAPKKVWTF